MCRKAWRFDSSPWHWLWQGKRVPPRRDPARGGGSSPLIRTKFMNKYELGTTEENIDFKLPAPADRYPIGFKFLDKVDPLPYTRSEIIDSLRYKSSVTGREYSDYQEMPEAG